MSNPGGSKSVTENVFSVTFTLTQYEKKHKLRIRFRIRPIKETPYSYILCRITLNGIRTRSDFSTGIKVETGQWDSKTQVVKGKASKDLNHQLDQIRMDLISNFETLKEKGIAFGPDDLRKSYTEEIPQKKTLVDVSAMVLSRKEEKHQLDKRATATIRKARERHNQLKWIFAQTGWEWPLEEIRTRKFEELELWLRNRENNTWHHNTISKILNYFKEVVRFGMSEGMIPSRPIVFRVTFKESAHYSLTLDQVRKLEAMDWIQPEMKQAADCFLFQCYTGLAYSDLAQFRPEIHLKVNSLEQAIELIRTKSPREGKVFKARLPLLPAARRILDKYDGRLPVISNQKYNPYLKAIGQVLQLDFKLTSHIARKSFCTILFNAGMEVEMIGEWVGHSTAKTTLASYIRGQVSEMEKRVTVLGFGT